MALVEMVFSPGCAISNVRAPWAIAAETACSRRPASCASPSEYRRHSAKLMIAPNGLAIPLPAISGALPWIGSYSA